MRHQFPTLFSLVILIACGAASAAVIEVPGDYPTIAGALAVAQPMDEVQVAPGAYLEYDLAMPLLVTLKGMGESPQDVVIDAQGQGRVLLSDTVSWIENLQIMGGAASQGGGLAVLDGQCYLTDVEIADCTANLGAGILVRTGSLEMTRCAITNNEADTAGGGIHSLDAPAVIILDSVFASNAAGAYGGAWSAARSAVTMEGCTVVENRIPTRDLRAGVGAEGVAFDGMGMTITRTISSGNMPDEGYATIESVLLSDRANRVETSCSLRWQADDPGWPGYLADQLGDAGARNIDYDPRFCYEPGDLAMYYGLAADSPCLPDNTGGCGLIGAFGQACGVTGTPDTPAAVFALHPAYPNPFNPQTTINYALDRAGPVTLVVYGLDGRRVATLVNEGQAAGNHSVTWAGLDDRGRSVASGVYLCRLQTGNKVAAIRMTMVK